MTYDHQSKSTAYAHIRQIVLYLSQHYQNQPNMEELAHAVGMDAHTMTQLFQDWAGITPKAFLQAVTLNHAQKLLANGENVLNTSVDVGLSSSSRLHDLFVTHHAMPPGIYRQKGAGLRILYGYHPSPFGEALLMVTEYGLASVAFVNEDEAQNKRACFEDMATRWPNANYIEDKNSTAPYAARLFDTQNWCQDQPLRVVMIGTDFEIRAWEGLLSIPCGRVISYGQLAQNLDKPKAARAVGRAVGRNPLSFVIPCHRVIGSDGALTGYHWGLTRKRIMLGWEACQK